MGYVCFLFFVKEFRWGTNSLGSVILWLRWWQESVDTMQSVEVGFLKIGKCLYVRRIVRIMSKQVRLLS